MARLIAFLRAINVGGHIVTMEELRRLFQELGFKDVQTFIASGNVIFSSGSTRLDAMEQTISRHLESSLGYPVAVFIRTDAEVAAVAQYQAFSEAKVRQARTQNVAFLSQALGAAQSRAVLALKSDVDDFHVNGREVYWLTSAKQGESQFSNALLERLLKAQATFRGLNTITRLAAKFCSTPSSSS